MENQNGFSNRVLWVAARRSKKIPRPKWINWRERTDVLTEIQKVIEKFTRSDFPDPQALAFDPFQDERFQFSWSEEGQADWDKFYDSIPVRRGPLGLILARADGHVLRLAMLYAALDVSTEIRPEHLRAAIAFWQYCERSARWIFGEKTKNESADRIYWALAREPEGMTRTQISGEVFKRNLSKTEIDMALSILQQAGLVEMKLEKAEGAKKPTERWQVIRQFRNTS